jgi:hypothetical protein
MLPAFDASISPWALITATDDVGQEHANRAL